MSPEEISLLMADIDRQISAQLNEIMHHPDFQKLEARWRGLHYLVDQTETGEHLEIRVLNVSKGELFEDMKRAGDISQSALFQKVCAEPLSRFAEAFFGVLIGDYEFDNQDQDINLLEKISQVAAAAHAPFISAASPQLFGLDNFLELGDRRRGALTTIFESLDYSRWRSFRDAGDSNYIALSLPHILLRLPYGQGIVPVESFGYEEDVDGTDHSKYLWGNVAYALGARITDAFAQYHWCAAIHGVEGGGLVQYLPVHTFRTDEGDLALKCPTEIAIDELQEKELADLGFIPLVHCKGTDFAAFFSTQTLHKPPLYDFDAANANARLASRLQYIFAVSRFAHYLKAIQRDRIGGYQTREQCEDFLNHWISQYVILDDDAGQERGAIFPLCEARIDVFEYPDRPGAYAAIAFLLPRYQMDELTLALRIVVDLPPQLRR